MPLPDLNDECFFIAPIGAEGSDIRRRSDGILRFVVEPAVSPLGLVPVRADEIAEPGQITLQVIQHVLGARGVVADLTGSNPNVYYELAIRHTARLPVVLIAESSERLPFDIAQMRTIFFDHTDLNSAADCRDKIREQLRSGLDGAVDSPIATAADVGSLEQGTRTERTLAELVTTIEQLSRDVVGVRERQQPHISPAAVVDLATGFDLLQEALALENRQATERMVEHLHTPIDYLRRRIPVAESQLARRERRLRSEVFGDVDEVTDEELDDVADAMP